jgi:hypothetical protein
MGEQYVGIDLHRRRSVIVRMTPQGEVLQTIRIDNHPVALWLELARPAPTPRSCSRPPTAGTGPPTYCRRAGPGCTWPTRWGQDVRLPASQDRRPRLHQPGRAAAHGSAPRGWLAPPQVRELRELVRYRAKLVALGSGLKAQVHAVLAKEGVRVPMSDLFGVAGSRLLDELRLGRAYALRIASLRSLITAYDQEIAMLGREISTALAGDIGYLAIQTIPGVGPVLAAVFVAEIGDVHRFAGAPPLCSWAGLTPATTSPTPPCAAAPSPSRAPGWSAGPRSRRCSGCLEEASRPPTSTASPTGAASASAASPLPASCGPWSTTACATARCAAWRRRPGRRCERLGRSPARARVCHDPAQRRVARLVEPARLRPHRSMPPWRGEGMTGTRARAALGQRLLAMELPPSTSI